MSTVLRVPAGTVPDELARWKAANTGAVLLAVQPLAVGDVPHQELHRSAWALIVDWLKPLLAAGATILVPGVLGPAVSAVVSRGLESVSARLGGDPIKEKWTVQAIAAEVATLEDPRT